MSELNLNADNDKLTLEGGIEQDELLTAEELNALILRHRTYKHILDLDSVLVGAEAQLAKVKQHYEHPNYLKMSREANLRYGIPKKRLDRPELREKIALEYCRITDFDYYTPMGRDAGNKFADQIRALIPDCETCMVGKEAYEAGMNFTYTTWGAEIEEAKKQERERITGRLEEIDEIASDQEDFVYRTLKLSVELRQALEEK